MPDTSVTPMLPLSAALIAARRGLHPVSAAVLPVPLDRAEAMRAQAEAARAFGATPGWKVAIGPLGWPAYAPLLSMQGAETAMPYPHGCILEVELGVRLARDLPPRPEAPYTRDELLGAIDMVFMGIEVIASRLAEGSKVPFQLWLADAMGNHSYIPGQELPRHVIDEVASLQCVLSVDDTILFDAEAVHANGDPLKPFLACLNDQSDMLGGFKAGQIVTTGSLCGGVPCGMKGRVEAVLGETRLAFTLT